MTPCSFPIFALYRGDDARHKAAMTKQAMTKQKSAKPESGFEGERIAKVMARAGLCSRREAESWIAAGRVAVNGATIRSPALNIGAEDVVAVDGKPLPKPERTRLFLYHKPRGLVTTHADPEGRPTIFGTLPKDLPRLISVGRLDLSTEGLLLLTNDGGLARILELPETGWLRRYRVRAHGSVTQAQLDTLRKGVTIDGMRYGEIEATLDRHQGANSWLTFAIREGKNREVRNVLEHLGLRVNRLIRVSFGPFQLGDLPESSVEEIRTRHLREQLGERIASAANVDFTGPIVQHRPAVQDDMDEKPKKIPAKPEKPSRRHPDKPTRHPQVRAERAAKDDRPQTGRHSQKPLRRHPEERAKRASKGDGPHPSRAAARPPQDDGRKKRAHRSKERDERKPIRSKERDSFEKKTARFKHRSAKPRGGKRDR
jgi:23S rRNA pseudouridine2605 synthase